MQLAQEIRSGAEILSAGQASGMLKLQVGARLQISTYRGARPVHYFSSLVGYQKDEYLLVKVPVVRNLPVSLLEGEKLTVRGFTGTSICSFNTSVIRTFARPYSFMHLDYPDRIESADLRKAVRARTSIAGRLQAQGQDSQPLSVEVRLLDLSVAGAQIASQHDLHGEQLLQLSFNLTHGGQDLMIDAPVVVRNARKCEAEPGQEQDAYLYGVEFLHLDPVHRTLIQAVTYETVLRDWQTLA